MKNIRFIVNPRSGVFRKDSIREVIESEIDSEKYSFDVVFTESPGHATLLCRQFCSEKVDVVVAVGGDGTINEVARGLIGTKTALGIVPGGSGNGLALHLNIPLSVRKALQVINAGKSIRIDTASLDKHLFLSIAGIGFDGLVAKKFAGSTLRGFIGYLKTVAEEYPKYKPRKYRIRLNGKLIKTRALFIVFANSDQFGFQTSIAPEARVDDGLLDVTIATKPPLIEIPILAGLLYWRKIDRSKYIKIYKTSEVEISTRKRRWANVDGEPVKTPRKFIVRIQPNSLNILVP